MQFNSVKGGNFTSAAKSLNKSTEDIFDASRTSAPDFTGISKQSIASRADVRNAATRAKGLVEQTQIKADSLVDRTKLKIKTEKDIADIKRPAKRMAGVVAGLGSISTAAMLNKDNKEAKAERLELKAQRDALNSQMVAGQEASNAKMQEILKSFQKSGGTEGVNTSGETKTTGSPVSDTDSTPRSVSPYTGGSLTQAQGTQLLIDQGMDPDNARIGGAVMMAESSGNPGARSHPDLEARTGEMSVGLWQHNKNTGEDRHGFYGIQDWSELKNPETNARATYRLWERRGGWGDWGAYTNGSYKKFL